MAQVSTYKRGEIWYYRFEMARVDGKRRTRRIGGFKRKKEAEVAGNKAFAEYNSSGVAYSPSEISYADFLDNWMSSYCRTELKAGTCESYEKRIRNHIKPALGGYKLSALSTEGIQKFLNNKYNSGLSRNTLVSLKGIISGSLKYAVNVARILPNNPATHARIPSGRVKPDVEPDLIERTCIKPEQIALILKRFPYGSSNHLPILFAYRCGLRLGEAYAVLWEDIDLENGTLSVNRQLQYVEGMLLFGPPKYDSYRTIRLDQYMLGVLKRAREDQLRNKENYGEYYCHNYETSKRHLTDGPSDNAREICLVNVRKDGSAIQPRTAMHASRVIRLQLGIEEFNFHSLRHTHATMLAELGALPKDIQNRLGHKDIAVTMNIYVHLTKEMEDVSLNILNGLPIAE